MSSTTDSTTPAATAGDAPTETQPAPRVLMVDLDLDALELIEEWLAAEGCTAVREGAPDAAGARFDLAIVDVPFPRQSVERLKALRAQHPEMPLLVLSPTLFSSAECNGPCAKALGVAGVLPKTASRDALISQVRRLSRREDSGPGR